jgi:hypothetical protein
MRMILLLEIGVGAGGADERAARAEVEAGVRAAGRPPP